MAYPPVIVVDKEDQEIGLEMLSEVWKKGLRHRTVRIMVRNAEGRILLQRRAVSMTIFPNCWDNSAAGHVDKGMTYLRAAIQEVTEELGIADPVLRDKGNYYAEAVAHGRLMNNFNQVYDLEVTDPIILYEPEEVSEVRWFAPEELVTLVREHPEECTAGLCQVVELYFSNGEDSNVRTNRNRQRTR